jgi:hypothetical protein
VTGKASNAIPDRQKLERGLRDGAGPGSDLQ